MSTIHTDPSACATQGGMRSLAELMSLNGRVAVVTGGGGRIGSAICDALAELGATIVVLDSAASSCSDTSARLRETYEVDAVALTVDLSDESETQSICSRVLREFGRLDILVHCAAFVGVSNLKGWATSFDQQSSETWRQALEVNLTAPFVLTQSCAQALAQSGHGSVINVSSIYGVAGPDLRLYEGTSLGNPAAYAASKGGLLQFTRWLATVLAPKVRVNAISPGGVFRHQPASFVSQYIARTPLQRMASEEDLKGAAAYLASDLSTYVTGQNLIVDGGWTTW